MAMTTTTIAPPSQSLYIRNLPEKLQKEDLRRELYILFSTYGPILDVTATKTRKMRGQAHVLFREMHSATQALRACQGFEMSGKQMEISYSRNRSNTLAKLTGTFNQPIEKAGAQAQAGAAASTFAAIPGAPGSAATTAMKDAPAKTGAEEVTEKVTEKAAAKDVPQKAVETTPVAGTKRARDEKAEEEEEEEGEEDDDDVEMEVENEEMESSEEEE
ncbi:hypothetical protein LTR35_010876 [Friedmanniomyces endolithicus]|uniref:RRM domain-containing protein n=1 Tax=Friedmanniomyces endolithicus TaxID=329885 RepID=A0AAN6J524_9PEZI|nr:hypothetical protein LTS00_015113 [Friedmanniomyces endolithicus]KAK0275606.1 hypothetical protein LTR35_010876 [Friedmanniomyces endolithicus]KAK0316125.1 hypothetical protein LTR82_012153 [Friedmanniomyces endolithicus]KAK0992602.1 hypothetical protein LTR54_011473 [Friedmanniomyces endolithicus]